MRPGVSARIFFDRAKSASSPLRDSRRSLGELLRDLDRRLAVGVSHPHAREVFAAGEGDDEENRDGVVLDEAAAVLADVEIAVLAEGARNRPAHDMRDRDVRAARGPGFLDKGEELGRVDLEIAVDLRIKRSPPRRGSDLAPALCANLSSSPRVFVGE